VGVYNHADSQPTRLGAALWKVLAAERGDLAAVEKRLLASGRVEAFLCGEAAEERVEMRSDCVDPVSIEWVYAVDPAPPPRLHVLGHAPRGESYELVVVDSFLLSGVEPDWIECERKHTRAIAPAMLERIRERFGEEAYRSARRQVLGEE
jgi:hypothetical protein